MLQATSRLHLCSTSNRFGAIQKMRNVKIMIFKPYLLLSNATFSEDKKITWTVTPSYERYVFSEQHLNSIRRASDGALRIRIKVTKCCFKAPQIPSRTFKVTEGREGEKKKLRVMQLPANPFLCYIDWASKINKKKCEYQKNFCSLLFSWGKIPDQINFYTFLWINNCFQFNSAWFMYWF